MFVSIMLKLILFSTFLSLFISSSHTAKPNFFTFISTVSNVYLPYSLSGVLLYPVTLTFVIFLSYNALVTPIANTSSVVIIASTSFSYLSKNSLVIL